MNPVTRASRDSDAGAAFGEERPSALLHEDKLRVLVVEDNAETLELVQVLLRLMGHEVDGADNGDDGLQMATTRRPDVALVDLGLPGLDGYELAERLRATEGYDRLWLVAVTGHGRPEDRARALDAGFDHYLVKPVDEIALRRAIALRSAPSEA